MTLGEFPGAVLLHKNQGPVQGELGFLVLKIGVDVAHAGSPHNVPLPAAALQFVVAHPAIPSFIAGTRTVEQLQKNLEWFSHPIPAEFWADLKAKGLLREDAPTP